MSKKLKVHKTAALGPTEYAPRAEYERVCSRCGGEGIDPEMPDCACDCCENGVETMRLTEAEALFYPGAERKSK